MGLNVDVLSKPRIYNPSQWNQRLWIVFLASIAAGIATYMGIYQLGLIDHVWDPVFGAQSQTVLDSDVSNTLHKWFRIPDSLMGSMAYLGDVIFALAGSTRRWQDRPWLVILFGIDVIPLGLVSAILVLMQKTVVHAYCFLCLVTAVISIVLIFFAYDEIWSCILYLREVWKKSRDKRVLWRTFCGKSSQIAYEAGEVIITRKTKGKSHVGTRR